MSKQDFDILGILYLMADSQDLVPQDAEDAMNEWPMTTIMTKSLPPGSSMRFRCCYE